MQSRYSFYLIYLSKNYEKLLLVDISYKRLGHLGAKRRVAKYGDFSSVEESTLHIHK